MAELILPEWPAPPWVNSLMTTRSGGVSEGPYCSFNLGDHVEDNPAAVAENRARLRAYAPAEPCWLKQVHGAVVVEADKVSGVPEADAAMTRKPGTACAVLTADCLPVLLCDRQGSVVAAAHAGWRGLAGGVLEAAVAAMAVPASEVMAWMGAAIGPQAFEVGDEVRQAFVRQHPQAATAFAPRNQKWLADIYLLARIRLAQVGVNAVYGGSFCTWSESQRFYSFRRDGKTGRMASLIWIDRGQGSGKLQPSRSTPES